MRPQQWVNTAPDEGAIPALLQRVSARLPVETIDEIWIFPTRRTAGVESTVIVITTFDPQPERRRVNTAHFTVTRDRKGAAAVQENMLQHALAPADAVEKVIEGVLRRTGEELATPLHADVRGDEVRWGALLETHRN